MQLQLKSKLGDLRETDASFLQEARERGRALKVGQPLESCAPVWHHFHLRH